MTDLRIVDYASLQASVADKLVRDDLTTQLPLFVQTAEAEHNRVIRAANMLKRKITQTVAGDDFYETPDDFLTTQQVVLIYGSERIPLFPKSMPQIERLVHSSVPNRPEYYSIFGDQSGEFALRLSPVPDNAYTIEYFYYSAIPPLVAAPNTNWLLTTHPDLYFVSTMKAACAYTDDDEGVAKWQAEQDRILDQVNIIDHDQEWTQSPMTSDNGTYTP